jgi:hypothetical protein
MNARIAHPLLAGRERLLRDRGAALVACAELLPLPDDVRNGLPMGVCIGVALASEVVAGIESGPTTAYAAGYDRANALLQRLADGSSAGSASPPARTRSGIRPGMSISRPE